MRARHLFILIFLTISSVAGLDEKDPADSAGAAVISPTVAPPTIPKHKTAGKDKVGTVDSSKKKRILVDPSDPKDTMDPKASRKVLELIIKIAEHPATWKQIHRVLETLEANNAAYSRRIDVTGPAGQPTSDELGWISRRIDRPGDKRNDVPDEDISVTTTTTSASTTTLQDHADVFFQHWKEVLFAAGRAGQEESDSTDVLHPQLLKTPSATVPVITKEESKRTMKNPWMPSVINKPEKTFEERLNDIEAELKKLSKLAAAGRGLQLSRAANRRFSAVNETEPLASDGGKKSTPRHPQFQYHKVQSANGSRAAENNSTGPNFWRRVASLKRAEGNQTARRNTFVAVSLAPKGEEYQADSAAPSGLATPPCKSCKKKVRTGIWKRHNKIVQQERAQADEGFLHTKRTQQQP